MHENVLVEVGPGVLDGQPKALPLLGSDFQGCVYLTSAAWERSGATEATGASHAVA